MLTRRLAIPLPAALLALIAAGLAMAGAGVEANPAAAPPDKTETWIEVRSPHFIVASNSNEKQARRAADQFEQIRAVFHKEFPKLRVDPGQPIFILAAKNENTLKALLPGFWEVKGHMHPAGLFVSGEEKHYIALRLDAEGENPFHIVYHEYVHILEHLNSGSIPVWLDEGFAEFYGNTTIGEKELKLGLPSESGVRLLRENKLLPLEVLFKVDHSSPYYNEANKTTIFYAESWALTHYLMLDEQMRKTPALTNYVRLLQNDVDSLEAARQAFGDLKRLQKNLESYVGQSSFHYALIKMGAEVAEKDYVARVLSPAESAARRGDFHLYMQRTTEARALLEEALRLDPNLALAHESVGLSYYRQGQREEAAKHFALAVQLDSRSYLSHFLHARLLVEQAQDPQTFAEAEPSLLRATELNPNFAPAYATLAGLYLIRKETLEKALAAARKAAELEPGEPLYYLNVGNILLRLERIEEARGIGQRIRSDAKSTQVRAAAESFLAEVARFQEYQALQKRHEEEARASREQLQSYLRSDASANTPSSGEAPSVNTSGTPPGAAGTSSARRYAMFGRLTQISCAAPPAMELTLSAGGLTMRLHATNYFKVDYLTTSWKPPANFNPCTHLKGLSAQISYTLAQGQAYDGEIVSIEVRR